MYGGPIGAFFGYQIGKYISRNFQSKETSFEMSLLMLSAIVIKVDGKMLGRFTIHLFLYDGHKEL